MREEYFAKEHYATALGGLVDGNRSIPLRDRMASLVRGVQSMLVSSLEEIERSAQSQETLPPAVFVHRPWTRDAGGGGTACVLENGRVFEKAGVNFSVVDSEAPAGVLAHMRARKRADIGEGGTFHMYVAGVSLVFHPRNPHAPTMHANYRFFELTDESGAKVASWFGGGCDLTPSYLYEEDARHFHRVIQGVCDRHSPKYYEDYKAWCDTYFRNTHRGESRGVGGIFFDDLEDGDLNDIFDFVNEAAHALRDQYVPIVLRRAATEYTDAQRRWQQLRRGRYVEFNLVHDRGTKFGLATPGVRIENVLMSLPLTARWEYDDEPQVGTDEQRLVDVLRTPIEWV